MKLLENFWNKNKNGKEEQIIKIISKIKQYIEDERFEHKMVEILVKDLETFILKNIR